MIGPFGARSTSDAGRGARIKGWAARAFGLEDGTPMTVAELRCMEPGCPPVETVIAILGTPGPPRQYKVHKPMSEVTFEDVAGLGIEPEEIARDWERGIG